MNLKAEKRNVLEIKYEEGNTHIVNSYLVKDVDLDVGCIMRERVLRKLPVTRTFESYKREWKAHNNMYNLHLFRKHTKDVDMEEPIKWYYELIYWIIGR